MVVNELSHELGVIQAEHSAAIAIVYKGSKLCVLLHMNIRIHLFDCFLQLASVILGSNWFFYYRGEAGSHCFTFVFVVERDINGTL